MATREVPAAVVVARESASGWRGFYERHVAAIRGLISLVVVVAVWEIGARRYGSPLIIVPLSSIWSAFVELLRTGELLKHLNVSMQEFILGFALASVVGIVLGMLMATSAVARHYVDPWISGLYSTPIIALAPLFIVWFGIGIQSKVAVVFLVAVFPILINTSTGILTTDRSLIEAARSFGATRMQIFRWVLIPSALPFIVAGERLGLARGLVGVVVGELFGAKAGLGFLILQSAQVFDTASLFVGVLTLAILGYLGVEALRWVEGRMAPWRRYELMD